MVVWVGVESILSPQPELLMSETTPGIGINSIKDFIFPV